MSTIDTTLAIVHVIKRKGSASIEGIVDELDLAASTVHRHLLTLREQGYIVKHDDYRLGMRFLTLGGHVQTTHPVFDLVKRKVDQVATRQENEHSSSSRREAVGTTCTLKQGRTPCRPTR
ncbi:helix-turn-helix domain-containing protein [Halarchaeum acidiphilum]|uniref:helix-turn-helix domain-containing protein n=1 Tax=Halarchaeum acidiphilum TaxID=489138 RepID=UPI00190115B1|nr:helix-turn-helix domain-containing protein [Halarchaeum acidiphilum]